ncbi:MAG: DoxX family protein [Alphaproteobacteria bacterium]|nr:DoxX family protein [Alphaproteobacteria bacterium]
MDSIRHNLPFVARGLLGLIFVLSGLGKLGTWDMNVQYIEAKGLFLAPVFLAGAVVVEVLGGLSVIAGYRARWGAAALAGFCIVAAFLFHAFWAQPAGQMQMLEMASFLKNLSIAGGLLMVVVLGPGARSFDARATV